MIIIVLLAVSCTLGVVELQRCPEIELLNGTIIFLRKRPRLHVQFQCNKNFELVGSKFAICSAGIWSTDVPFCVGTMCPVTEAPPGIIVEKLYNGGVLSLTCDPGLARVGAQRIMCLAGKWNKQLAVCAPIMDMTCDFEHEDLCGWSQDTEEEFDWIWHQGSTPTPNTGPLNDHTLNSTSGHYLFIESSAPQKFGNRARLLSPVYSNGAVDGMCVQFYYHMYGPDIPGEVGTLDLYILLRNTSTNSNGTTEHIFHREGNQGDQWIWAEVYIPPKNTTLQLAFQATRLKGSFGDIAIDDVTICNCSQSHELTKTTAMKAKTKQPELTTEETLLSKVPVTPSDVEDIVSPKTHRIHTFLHPDRRKVAVIMSTNPPISKMMSSDKTQTNSNILSDTYPFSDKTQTTANSTLHTDYSTKKGETDTDILSHNYHSDKTRTVTNMFSYVSTSSARRHAIAIINSTQSVIDNEYEVSDTHEQLHFETRNTLIFNIVLLSLALLAALCFAWKWVIHKRCRGRVTEVETKRQVVYKTGYLSADSRLTRDEAPV